MTPPKLPCPHATSDAYSKYLELHALHHGKHKGAGKEPVPPRFVPQRQYEHYALLYSDYLETNAQAQPPLVREVRNACVWDMYVKLYREYLFSENAANKDGPELSDVSKDVYQLYMVAYRNYLYE